MDMVGKLKNFATTIHDQDSGPSDRAGLWVIHPTIVMFGVRDG